MTRPARLKALSLLLILCLLLSLSACKQRSPEYKIVRENGKVYVDVGRFTYIQVPGILASKIRIDIYFESFNEMYDDIRHGHFSEIEMKGIGDFPKDYYETKAEIVDFENLYKPDLPQGFKIQKIRWEGTRYWTSIAGNDGIGAIFTIINKESFDKSYADYTNPQSLDKVPCLSSETDPATGNIISLFGETTPTLRSVFYPLPESKHTAYVYETYDLSVSENIPKTVRLIIDQGEVCCSYAFSDLNAPMSADDLRQFGVQKHVPIAFYAEGILPIVLIIASVVLLILLNKRMKRAAEAAAQTDNSDNKPLRKADLLFCRLNNIQTKVKNMIKNNRKLILAFIIIWLCFALFIVILNYALLAQPLVDDLYAPARLIPTPRFLAERVENKMPMEEVFSIIGYPDWSLTNSTSFLRWDLMDGNVLTLEVSNGTARHVQIVNHFPNSRWMLLPAILLTFATAEVVPYLILRKKITRSTTADPQE